MRQTVGQNLLSEVSDSVLMTYDIFELHGKYIVFTIIHKDTIFFQICDLFSIFRG